MQDGSQLRMAPPTRMKRSDGVESAVASRGSKFYPAGGGTLCPSTVMTRSAGRRHVTARMPPTKVSTKPRMNPPNATGMLD